MLASKLIYLPMTNKIAMQRNITGKDGGKINIILPRTDDFPSTNHCCCGNIIVHDGQLRRRVIEQTENM